MAIDIYIMQERMLSKQYSKDWNGSKKNGRIYWMAEENDQKEENHNNWLAKYENSPEEVI